MTLEWDAAEYEAVSAPQTTNMLATRSEGA